MSEATETARRRRVPQIVWWIGLVLVVLVVGVFATLIVRNALATAPANLGVVDGRLRPCPASPNCVCTQDDDAQHKIEPLTFTGTPEEALDRLKSVIRQMPRTRFVADDGGYLRVEFTTRLMRYVDDVEFFVDDETKRIHFRSASRVGYSDLGANRQRMETVRAAFNAQ